MSAPTEGLMRLIALTKQKRDIGPMLQEYVCRKYGVENMAAFTRGVVPGVDDKESLYLQWIEWIESGEFHRFTEPEVPPQEDEDDLLAAMLADASIAPPDPEPETAGDGEYEDDDLAALAALVGAEAADAMEEVQPESSADWDEPLPTQEPANPVDEFMAGMTMDEDVEFTDPVPDGPDSLPVETLSAENPSPAPGGRRQDETPPATKQPVSGSIDALVLSLVRQEIAALPQPEQGVSEERIRQIVREEIRAVLRSALG